MNKIFIHVNKIFVHKNKTFIHVNKTFIGMNKILVHMNKTFVGMNKIFIHVNKNMIKETFMIIRDWIPHGEQDLVDLIHQWNFILPDTEKQTAFGWDADECSAVLLKLADYLNARTEYKAVPTSGNWLAKDEAKWTAVHAMRSFSNSSVRFNTKMTAADKLLLGVHTPDTTPTPKPTPTDYVDFEISTLLSDHRVIAKYRIRGSTKRGKGPYHAVEIRYYVRALDAAAPLDANEEGWHSESNTASPWLKTFPGTDAGKRLYLVMRWVNSASSGTKTSGKGPWSEIVGIIIP
jgi:hypothetical protein